MEVKEYKEEEYRIIFGVDKPTFDRIVKIVEQQYKKEHEKGGRKDGATPTQRVEITLKYIRQYYSQRYIASEYGIAKSCIAPIVKWVLKIIVKDPSFSLPNKVENIYDLSEDRIFDATESKIDMPEENQDDWFSGKKEMHTIKTQIEAGMDTHLIYSVRFSKGSVHDFKLFKESKWDFRKEHLLMLDKGYVGINKIHANSIVPIKASKNHKLTKEEKKFNVEVSKIRIVIEHVNAFIKKFKIVSTRFRNRRKNFKLYMTVICGIYNFETANL